LAEWRQVHTGDACRGHSGRRRGDHGTAEGAIQKRLKKRLAVTGVLEQESLDLIRFGSECEGFEVGPLTPWR
jgi:hypothetical protein